MSGEDGGRGENCRQLQAVSSLTLSLVPHPPFYAWDSQQAGLLPQPSPNTHTLVSFLSTISEPCVYCDVYIVMAMG